MLLWIIMVPKGLEPTGKPICGSSVHQTPAGQQSDLCGQGNTAEYKQCMANAHRVSCAGTHVWTQ